MQAALLSLAARRLEREGKPTECAAKYAAAAKLQLAKANRTRTAAHNNAAIAYEQGFDCSSDPQALRDADATLEQAYRNNPEDPIVVGNLTFVLGVNGTLRVLARHVDVRALRLRLADIGQVTDAIRAGPEWTALLAELAADPSVRRASGLLAQFEVLMPNSAQPYGLRFREALRKRDADAAAAVVERARHAKAIDVSEAAANRERWRAGKDDAKYLADLERDRQRLEAVLARPGADRLSANTRAVGWYLLARALGNLGVYRTDKAALVLAREAAANALRLWPALSGEELIVDALIDEAALDGDAKAWIASRRDRGAVAALDHVVATHSPLAAKIRAAPQWTEVAAHVRGDAVRPSLADLRLARLLGDPALEAHARAVLDDRLTHLGYELAVVLDPSDEASKQDLADLDRR